MQQNEVCTVLQGKRSIMVIVPHEDDELLLMGGVIRHAVKMGMEADIVIATNGDFGCWDRLVGHARLRETMAAMAMLGVPERNLCIMGYADTGMPKADSFLTHLYEAKDGDKIYPSLCSATTYGLEEKPEYHMQRYGVHGDYCRNTFKQDLKEIIASMLCGITRLSNDSSTVILPYNPIVPLRVPSPLMSPLRAASPLRLSHRAF